MKKLVHVYTQTKPNYEKNDSKSTTYLVHNVKKFKVRINWEKDTSCYCGQNIQKRTVNSKYNEYGLMDFTSGSIVAKINEDYQSLMNGITIQKRSKLKVELMIKLLQRLSVTFYTKII